MVEKTLKRDGFRAQTRFYHWDEEDRLIRVSLPNGDIWHYEYDVFGRRCRKYRQQPATQPTSAQSLTQQISQGDIRYQWLGDQLSQQQSYYADGSVATTQWLYEPGSFRPLAQIRQLDTPNDPGRPELHYAVTDLAGNVRELCDPQGQIHWRGEQGLWQDFHQWRLSGTPKKYLEQAANEPLHCDLRYQGQVYDRETGLYYNRHRYYDPETCQYLSPDPIGLAGGTRPQAYVHNPLEWVDPLGLAGDPAKATHITYLGWKDGKPYVGYASKPGFGHSAQDVLNYRYSQNYEAFDIKPDPIYHGEGVKGKYTARGLEQRKFEELGGLDGTSNKQNPVGEKNPRRSDYLNKADEYNAMKLNKCPKGTNSHGN
ncbi:hypothetical protein GII14_04970 [Shewanella chilikensis]|uniref:RHS repeat protein n=3 Tax=Shewanella chilikensis TaxID=558541 RepID=A0A6G7LXY5_9GAMM|nr:hypothetical protein GII14_04970 [Shewanella chilikensis]